MCYSVETIAGYQAYVEKFGAHISIKEFYALVKRSQRTGDMFLPQAVENALLADTNADLQELQDAIRDTQAQRLGALGEKLHAAEARLANADAKLAVKETKTALNDRRIASNLIETLDDKIRALQNRGDGSGYARIFPKGYAPVLCVEDGQLVVMPMRYQCRPEGKPVKNDELYPGTYNARLDTILAKNSYWRHLFGSSHGIILIRAFHENVEAHTYHGRDLDPGRKAQNMRLRFVPDPPEDMIVPCLWSRWSMEGQPDLLSFAVITNDPPPEVSGAGHDRCPMQLKPEHVDAWLHPEGRSRDELVALLLDKPDVIYRHEVSE